MLQIVLYRGRNHLPAVCWGNIFLVPGQRHLDAITVHTHSLPVPFPGTGLLPATFLPEGMVAMTPGLVGHSSVLHTYDPMKPKHTLKELLYSRASTSGRIFNFKAYLHIYCSTSKSRVFFERLQQHLFAFDGDNSSCLCSLCCRTSESYRNLQHFKLSKGFIVFGVSGWKVVGCRVLN